MSGRILLLTFRGDWISAGRVFQATENDVTSEPMLQLPPEVGTPPQDALSDRRADIDSKQWKVAHLLQQTECEGLLLLDPRNFSWYTSGAMARGVLDPSATPALYCNAEQRWLIASNADSQRLFDEELDGLGFQLKEWPWHWGREQFLADLCQGRKVACDQPRPGLVHLPDQLEALRLSLTPYEQACMLALGQILVHALEATCRSLSPNDTEREAAGQLSHRLLHRGAHPLHIGVAADDRSRVYRQFSFTPTPIKQFVVISATARKYGLIACASRAVSFGEPPPRFGRDQNAVCRVGASYLASTWPDAVPREILLAGRRIYLISEYEHEWMLAPQGQVTGRAPVELLFTPQTDLLLQENWAVTWHPRAGAACGSDTYLVTNKGPRPVTPAENWPLKRIRIQGAEFIRPDILIR